MRAKCFYMMSIILTFIVISESCTKDHGRYELFPLRIGNEYYYQYSYTFDDILVGNSTIGSEKWTVLTDSVKNKNIEYFIEKKLNAIHINWSQLATNSHSDTTIIKDSIGYFIITENPKGELLFFDITIPRYSNKPDSIIQIYGSSQDYYKTFYFSAGRGLTRYYKFWGVMGNRIRESYTQDSVKIAN